jgi:putative redox protein
MIHAKVKHRGVTALQFEVETGSGHHFVIDDTVGKTGPKPIELVAAALAGCTAFDVITILRNKKHKTLTGYEVMVEADQRQAPPQVFTQVRIHHAISGYDIDRRSVEDAIHLSDSKYCSVGAMIRQSGAEVLTTYSIHPVGVEDTPEATTAVSMSKRAGETPFFGAPKRGEPGIDRERELALLESATKEPC